MTSQLAYSRCETTHGRRWRQCLQLILPFFLLAVLGGAPMAAGLRALPRHQLRTPARPARPAPALRASAIHTTADPHSSMQVEDSLPLPNMAHAIRLVPLEYNLQSQSEATDGSFAPATGSRVELLLWVTDNSSTADSSTGKAVWAPLCATTGDVAQYHQDAGEGYDAGFWEMNPVANIACNQLQDPSSAWSVSPKGYLRAPLRVPEGLLQPGTESDDVGEEEDKEAPGEDWSSSFDPSAFTHWVTVVGGIESGVHSLQEMELEVSTTRCATGFLYNMACVAAPA